MEYSILALSISLLGIFVHNWITTSALRERIARLECKFDLVFSALEKKISESLISPGTPELDALLSKVAQGEASPEDISQLKAKLLEELPRVTGCRKLAISLILGLLEASEEGEETC